MSDDLHAPPGDQPAFAPLVAPGRTLSTPGFDYHDETLGSRARVALFLATEVGEGGRFRKQALRLAFPGIDQVDRRMRELRTMGWAFDYASDPEDQRVRITTVTRIGLHIWNPEVPRPTLGRISAVQSRRVLERDRVCTICGIAAGEQYAPDDNRTAQLIIQYIVPPSQGGSEEDSNLHVVCLRHSGGQWAPQVGKEQVQQVISSFDEELDARARTQFLSWVLRGQRSFTPAERLWAVYQSMGPRERETVRSELAQRLEDQG
ncbi:hypothetical protein [Kineococcus sp. SYSU DK006]|uniref:hypothetical protein n=1 Tax=Kineococcus sp. SYSU DK006 TaxID=3383127 RepID=UPI003D7EF960